MTSERKGALRVALISILAILVVVGGVLAVRSMWTSTSTKSPIDRPPPQSVDNPSQPVPEPTTPTALPATEPQTPEPKTFTLSQPESGRLAFEAQGKKLGEEAYLLERLPTGEYKLSSQGFFSFNVLASEVKFEYTQETQLNADLRPLSFSLEFHGPLGLGNRSTKIQIAGESALISSGDKPTEVPVPKERFLLLGMFSSYVLAARMLTDSDQLQMTAFIAAGFLDPKSQTQLNASSLTVPLKFVKQAPVRIRDKATGKEREVEQYLLKLGSEEQVDQESDSPQGLQLLATNGEFLGLLGTSQDASRGEFRVYRMDLFLQGFEVLPPK